MSQTATSQASALTGIVGSAAISLNNLGNGPLSPVPSRTYQGVHGSSTGYRDGAGVNPLKNTKSEFSTATYRAKETQNPFRENNSGSDSGDLSELEEDYDYSIDKKKCWLVVFGSFMGLVPTWGLANSIGVLQTHILENELKGTDTTTVSWIFSIFLCLSMIASIFSGTYFDRNGSRLPIFVGTCLVVGSMFSVANCTKTWQFILAFGVCLGLGCGILGAPLIGAVPHYFPRNQRATALAVAGNGGCCGGLLIPLMLRTSYRTIGYAWSMRALGIISLICLSTAFFLVKERELVEKKPMSRLQVSTIVVASGYYSFICVKSGFSQSESFLFVTLMNAFAIPSRWISGIVADRWFGPYNVIIVLLCMTSVVEFVIWLPFKSSPVAIYLFSILYGITYGGIMSLIPSCCSQVVKAEKFGARYATQYAICGGTILGLMSAGSGIIGSGHNDVRNSAFVVYVALMGLIGALCYTITRTMCVGFRLKKF
ncbi:hypothetical protein HII13_001363 [Brettanomyces bruxellensis]|nr:hypothetical protein HII13_001363 [Brettanomyces bruxellensis]